MENVAFHLADQALISRNHIDKDCFGRSAFNRFYYSIFLEVREFLTSLNPAWETPRHARISTIINTEIVNIFTRSLKHSKRHNDTEMIEKCKSGIQAAKDLSDIYSKCHGARVAADYHHEIRVDFSQDGQFSINEISNNDYTEWLIRIRALISAISNTWGEIHGR